MAKVGPDGEVGPGVQDSFQTQTADRENRAVQPPSAQKISKERRGTATSSQINACVISAHPVCLRCPHCHHFVTTQTTRQGQEQDSACFLVLLLCAAGCCLEQKSETIHTCPHCGKELGRHSHTHTDPDSTT